MNLCDIKDIKKILERHNFSFSKAMGQNFLIDESIPQAISDMCGVSSLSSVLEIGPGIGALTQKLAERALKVVSLELDKRLLPILEHTLSDYSNIHIVNCDVMKTDFAELFEKYFHSDDEIFVAANLPYYITTPVISKLIEFGKFSAITVMVQKEVAERICASNGTKDYGSFTVYLNYYADVEILFHIPSDKFLPKPKVDSAVIKITPHGSNRFNVHNEDMFFKVIKSAFSNRRKTLCNALLPHFNHLSKLQMIDIIKGCGLDEKIRGECLTIEQFAMLALAIDT